MSLNSLGLRCTEFPPSPEPGDQAALSPAPTWAWAKDGPPGLWPGWGRAASGQAEVAAGPPLTPAFSALPEAGGGPASGRSPRRPAARGGARGLSPRAGEFWESPAQGGGLAAARAAVRAARRARRARSEGAAPGWAHTGTRGGRAGGGGRGPGGLAGRERRRAARPRLCLPGTCLVLALSWQPLCR